MKPILFTIYNHFYKNGENKRFKFFQPLCIVSLTLSIIFGSLIFYSYYTATGIKIRYFKMVMYLLLFIFYTSSYYLFVSRKGFELLYNEYKNRYSEQELKRFKLYTILFYCLLFALVFYLAMRINGQSIFHIPLRV